jgi:hypothetical protein
MVPPKPISARRARRRGGVGQAGRGSRRGNLAASRRADRSAELVGGAHRAQGSSPSRRSARPVWLVAGSRRPVRHQRALNERHRRRRHSPRLVAGAQDADLDAPRRAAGVEEALAASARTAEVAMARRGPRDAAASNARRAVHRPRVLVMARAGSVPGPRCRAGWHALLDHDVVAGARPDALMMKRTAAEPRSTIANGPARAAVQVSLMAGGWRRRASRLRLDEPAELAAAAGPSGRSRSAAPPFEGEAVVVPVHAEIRARARGWAVADHRDRRVRGHSSARPPPRPGP